MPPANTDAPAMPVPAAPPPGKEAVDAAAQPQKNQGAQPKGFTGELAAAAAKPAEPAPAQSRPQTGSRTQPAASQAAPAEATVSPELITAPVAAVAPATNNNGRDSDGAGNHGRMPSQQGMPQAAEVAAVPTAEDSDVAQIAAIVRHAANGSPPASRPADAAPNPTLTAEPALTDIVLDETTSVVTPEPAKTDAPSRPFGNVAPGLTLAAQITAQQTPDQANAAEKLAQLAAAKESSAAEIAAPADGETAAAADAAATPTKLEQTAPVEGPSQRTISVDAASAAAASRQARPAFHPLVAQVAMHVAQAAAEGSDRINIRLSPSELGRIDVRLDFGPDGRVQAVFAADRPQTVELLQRDARDLERALQDAGLRADSGSLSFNLRGDGRNGAQSFAEMAGNSRREEAVAEPPVPQVQAYTAGSAAPGRLDIRI
jgi:flagellar hook-length control protein FliK